MPLGPEDRAILRLESATVAGHTCKVVRLGPGAPDVPSIRARISERIGSAPALTTRLGGTATVPVWQPDPTFDVARHVVAIPTDAPVEAGELPAIVAARFEQRLDRSRPLWQIDVVRLSDGGAALVWRLHHALADGTAAVRYARLLLWDGVDFAASATHEQAQQAADDARRRAHLAGFLRREFARHGRSPFDGTIGIRREVGFATVALRPLHDAARALDDATLNDALLSILAGALRRWIELHHGRLGSIAVRVPVSLHEEGDAASNRDSFFTLPLPLAVADPVARLDVVRRATKARKAADDAEHREALLRELAGISPGLERFVARLERSPRRFALTVSNVRGPREPVHVLGAPVEAMHSIGEIGLRHALRVCALSYVDTLSFGFCADPGVLDEVRTMAQAVATEAAALVAAGDARD